MHRWFASDAEINRLYPMPIRQLAIQHWTPLRIAKIAAEFLVPHRNARVLDIGSGVGKFALAGAYYKPEGCFYGVEQRKHLVGFAEKACMALGLSNVHFYAMNMAELDFGQFDHFYFYNSFYENLLESGRIDDHVMISPSLYQRYSRRLYKKLAQLPAGTRIATYHCLGGEVPPQYQLLDELEGSLLKFWIKSKDKAYVRYPEKA